MWQQQWFVYHQFWTLLAVTAVTLSQKSVTQPFVEDFKKILDFRQKIMTSFQLYVIKFMMSSWFYNTETVTMTSFHLDFKITSYISFEFDIFHNFKNTFPQKNPICNFTLIIGFLDFPPSYWSEYPRTLWIWPWLWGRSRNEDF